MVNNLKYNYSKLRGKIREVFNTERDFAVAMNLSKATISAKLNNAVEFSQTEIDNACSLLEIDQSDISTYFFTPKVQ